MPTQCAQRHSPWRSGEPQLPGSTSRQHVGERLQGNDAQRQRRPSARGGSEVPSRHIHVASLCPRHRQNRRGPHHHRRSPAAAITAKTICMRRQRACRQGTVHTASLCSRHRLERKPSQRSPLPWHRRRALKRAASLKPAHHATCASSHWADKANLSQIRTSSFKCTVFRPKSNESE